MSSWRDGPVGSSRPLQAQDAGHPLAGAHCAPPDKGVRTLEPALWPRPNNGSRMTRECHVRFCESRGWQPPRATYLLVTAPTKEILEQHVLPSIEAFLAERGLVLNREKTRIVSI